MLTDVIPTGFDSSLQRQNRSQVHPDHGELGTMRLLWLQKKRYLASSEVPGKINFRNLGWIRYALNAINVWKY